ncbi:hypothetical protein Q1695_014860 [Nippostrongylus brasiliensis]|nr:hypothetical protein Q1695_014860 [Nippostrongylus brasiliensis]
MLDSSEIPMFVFPVAVAVRVAPSAKVAGGGAAQQTSVRLDNTLFCHRPMDANSKVTKYLADLNSDGARRSKESSTHINTAALQTLRGPGQAAHDPLQFVSTSALSMAEQARQLMSITEQQKRERNLLAQKGSSKDHESWQDDLDTWRRKRKTKVTKQDSADATSPARDYRPAAPKDYHSLPGYGRMHKV